MPDAPQAIAEKGERIYKERFKQEMERTNLGKFLAIDTSSEQGFLGETPEEAIENARKVNPSGYFHLIKVGSAGVYQVGHTGGRSGDWVFRLVPATHTANSKYLDLSPARQRSNA